MSLRSRRPSATITFVLCAVVCAPEHGECAPDAAASSEDERLLLESLAADTQTVTASGQSRPTPASGTPAPVATGQFLDIAAILDVAAAYFDGTPRQVGSHDPTGTGFTLQQLELSLSSYVDTYFRLDAFLVLSQFGIEIEEAYATTLALPFRLQMRAGQFLTRFGRSNATHPHSWDFVDLALVNGKFFGGEGSRGLGVETSWIAPLPWYVELTASLNDAAGECCARTFLGGSQYTLDGPEDFLATTAIKQFFPIDDNLSLALGVSGQFGPNASGHENRSEIFGVDLYLRWRPVASQDRRAVSLTVEALRRSRQLAHRVIHDSGMYSQLVWTLNPQWAVGGRYEFVEGIPDDPLDPKATDDRWRASLQATYHPSHFSRLRLQVSYDRPRWEPKRTLGVMLALEVLAGAHPAHQY